MATTEFIAAIELSSSKISGIAGKKNSDGSIQVLAALKAVQLTEIDDVVAHTGH